MRPIIVLSFVLLFCTSAFAQKKFTNSDDWVSADVLKATLAAKTPEEKKYCEDVVRLRNAGTLPSRIFYGVYQKTLSKERTRRFYYFKTALEAVYKPRSNKS